MIVLDVNKITKSFGGLTAVSNVSMHIDEMELVGLIGPNGAGKTTLFNLLTGIYQPSSGTISIKKNDNLVPVSKKGPNEMSKIGVSRTFQNIRLFRDQTVIDNVRTAMHNSTKYTLFDTFFRSNKYYEQEDRITEKSIELLSVFHLAGKMDELAKNLPYGEQRLLEIARALATRPQILLLDEPAAGMNPSETAQLTKIIALLREKYQLCILLIEHDMALVMQICERIYVLDYGMLIAQGLPNEIKANKRVIEAYLGENAY